MAQKVQHAILRFAKHKAGLAGALEAHHERTKEKYASNPDIDISKSKDNFHIIQPTQKYRKEIDTRIKAAGCRTRKDSTMFVDTLITASPEFFTGRSKKEVQAYFTEAVAFMEKKVGRGNIFSAVVHMDEKTPHLHLCFTPITEDGRLSAKEILGNRVQLSKWQDEFHAHMKKVFPVLKRGESALVTKRKHIPTWLFKQSVDLTRQQQAIEKAVSEIGVLNAGKKRDEILEMVGPYFSRLEKHLGTYGFISTFEHILTDRGTEFGDPEALETGANGIQRTSIYYCDPMHSGQKGGLEQAHTMLRMVLPKGTSFEFLTQWDVNLIVNHINSTPRESLGGRTPYSVVLETLGEEVLNAFQLRPIAPDEVNLTPKLIRFNS